ncbi:hypothetical protein MCSF7_01951 [Mycoplasmopsis columbina SF7]|uniref:Uncharacterized protein n=1 Tax=Mycoplasmopsis columbina SF7 TaxID=1037410 RepID=F9UKH7_9BACT|nr:hypothetical protein MCSF7_01951 [Mycoplasmopsis columbina SF7]
MPLGFRIAKDEKVNEANMLPEFAIANSLQTSNLVFA